MVGNKLNPATLPPHCIGAVNSCTCVAFGSPHHALTAHHVMVTPGMSVTFEDGLPRTVLTVTRLDGSIFAKGGSGPDTLDGDLLLLSGSPLPFFHRLIVASPLPVTLTDTFIYGGWGNTSAEGVRTWTEGTQAQTWGYAKVTALWFTAPWESGGHSTLDAPGFVTPVTGDSGSGLFLLAPNELGVPELFLLQITTIGDTTGNATGKVGNGFSLDYPLADFLNRLVGAYPIFTILTESFTFLLSFDNTPEGQLTFVNPQNAALNPLPLSFPITTLARVTLTTGAHSNTMRFSLLRNSSAHAPSYPPGTSFDSITTTQYLSTDATGLSSPSSRVVLPFFPTKFSLGATLDYLTSAGSASNGASLSALYRDSNTPPQVASAQAVSHTRFRASPASVPQADLANSFSGNDLLYPSSSPPISLLDWLSLHLSDPTLLVYTDSYQLRSGSSSPHDLRLGPLVLTLTSRVQIDAPVPPVSDPTSTADPFQKFLVRKIGTTP